MSKNICYEGTKLVKKRKTKKRGRVLTFFICVLTLTFVIFLSGIFSGVLTVGNFSNLFSKNSNSISAHNYYMISMGKYDLESEAQSVASGTAVMGAGSYVWFLNGSYYVVGNIYKSMEEANSVYNNINGIGNYEISIVEVPFKKVTVNEKTYTSDQIKTIVQAINNLSLLYEKCYDYSIKLDKNEVNTTYVSSELNNLKSEAKIVSAKLDAINSYAVSEITINTKNAYISVVDALDNAILKVISGNSANSDLRYLVSKIVVAKYNLFQNI